MSALLLLIAAWATAGTYSRVAPSAPGQGLVLPAPSLPSAIGESPILSAQNDIRLQDQALPDPIISVPALPVLPAQANVEVGRNMVLEANVVLSRKSDASTDPLPDVGEDAAAPVLDGLRAAESAASKSGPASLAKVYDYGLLGAEGDAIVGPVEGAALPQSWTLERLEAKVETLNEAIRMTDSRWVELLPVRLAAAKVMVDDFSYGKASREEVRRALSAGEQPDLRDAAAFNLFGEKVLAEDLLLYSGTRPAELAAALLHETLAAAGMLHEEIEGWVLHLTRYAFLAREQDLDQPHLEAWAREARYWGDERLKQPSRPKPAAAEVPFDTDPIPVGLTRLQMAHYVGFAENGGPPAQPFKEAELHFSSPEGVLAIGVGPAAKGGREPRLWWKRAGEEEWTSVWLTGAEELRNEGIHRIAADKDDPDLEERGPAVSYERFRVEVLPHLDAIVSDFLGRNDPVSSAAFARAAYRAFRANFARLSGLELPGLQELR